jgi:hypothetical protein
MIPSVELGARVSPIIHLHPWSNPWLNPTTDVPLQRSVPVRVPDKGGGSGLEARLRVTVRGVVTTTLMVT